MVTLPLITHVTFKEFTSGSQYFPFQGGTTLLSLGPYELGVGGQTHDLAEGRYPAMS